MKFTNLYKPLQNTDEILTKGINVSSVTPIHADVSMVNSSDELDIENSKLGERDISVKEFVMKTVKYIVGREMKKCLNQIQCSYSDDICNEYGRYLAFV
jgi:leucyl-tRNA synthetase